MSAGGVLRYTLVLRNPETLMPEALLEGQPVPAWAKGLVHAEDLAVDAAKQDSTGASGEPTPYAKRKKSDLEALVAERNEGRDEDDLIEVEGKGTVADLAAALDADDAAQADTGQ